MTPRLQDRVLVTETEDGAVLLNERSGQYWQLNSSGWLILQTLLRGGSPDMAADALVARYPVEPEQARADVEALLATLRRARLMRR
ncbi:MAG: lasso peptide biosynthesis PqqD family chaperone [Micromonosporaceae bacterium]